MKIIVCIKQVPGNSDATIDPVTKRIVREGAKAVLNPFDLYAVEEALRLRERVGGEVTALSMGPPKAEVSLREALSIGADKAVLLSDRAFGGSDTWATSYALSKAIRALGGADMVLCGKQAVDGDTAQVGPGIAANLDWLQATYVSEILEVTPKYCVVRRLNEEGSDLCRLAFPCVLTVVKGINVPRVPTLRGVLASREKEVPVWKPADIGADPGKVGLDPSPTRVIKTEPPPPRAGETLRLEGEPAEAARRLLEVLTGRGLIS
jgi:electron transfer flavoprotein beta subunit